MMQILGYAMILAMFVGLFGLIWFIDGLRMAAATFGILVPVVVWVVVAAHLIAP